jgi:multidrug resistance efflux pump
MEKKMDKKYKPDNQFVDRLEWQLSSEYRRADRLKASSGQISVSRRMVAIAIAIGVLMTGVAVTKAADYIKESWQKKIEMARVETEVELKKVRLESIREMTSDIKSRVSNGLIRGDEYEAMKIAVKNAELDFKRSQLNLEEVQMSGGIPRNELYAPLVGGRDFVSERLEIDIMEVELNLEHLKIPLKRVKQLVEQDMMQRVEMEAIQAEIATHKVNIDKIQRRLDLRKRFLAGEITAREVELEGRLTAAENNFHSAQAKVDSLKEQINRMQNLEAKGAISHMEIRQMEFALDAAQAELKLATLEMNVLEELK